MSRKITTKIAKAEIELKDWITGREQEYIDEPIKNLKAKMSMDGKGEIDFNIGEITNEQTKRKVEVVVIKVNGSNENVWQKIQDLPNVDYQFVLEEVNKIIKGEDFTQPA